MFNRISQIEPLFPRENKTLIDLVMQVYREGSELGGLVNPITRNQISNLLRHINSYYSNRIEGEHTTPFDIERAVRQEYSTNSEKKRLQQLSVAHIEVQKLIDERLNSELDVEVCSKHFLCWIHREFYQRVPQSFLKIYDPDKSKTIIMKPGEIRRQDVKVGNHVAPAFGVLDDFLAHFEQKYSHHRLAGHTALLAAAASHHRLVWIHPFLDGNGRVSRLFTYAYLRKANLESYGLWTLSRGLARNDEYYRNMLAHADKTRMNDVDGRGNLSEKALTEFCTYFFEVALDQIKFMNSMLRLDILRDRIIGYVTLRSQELIPDEKELRIEAKYVLSEIMIRGEIARGEVQHLIGLGERTATKLISTLLQEELVVSESHRSPLRFNIPFKVVGYYFPNLYPVGSV